MKILGLIILFLFSLAGCKTKKSHVEKLSIDSLIQVRELSNSSVLVISTKEQNSSFKKDSSWNRSINMVNFTGVIWDNGKVEGTADQASINQSGLKAEEGSIANKSNDSSSATNNQKKELELEVNKENSITQKQTKGFEIPWYVWILGLGIISIVIYANLNPLKTRIKNILKVF